MMVTFIHICDWVLWIFMAFSVCYVAFFSLASLLPKRHSAPVPPCRCQRFLVIFPAYHEDCVIRHSVEAFLRQDYPRDAYCLMVVSDHMLPETNQWLASQPLRLLQPVFQQSSKARALQYAIQQAEQTECCSQSFDRVVILDADNIVAPDFLSRLNELCAEGHRAVQCHRTAKNADSDIAVLDGVSEEINNTVFRRAHNRVGLSSALIGSGMCFDYDWFSHNVGQLSTAGEDRELEALLLRQRVHIHYADDLYVMDEKVSTGDNFQRQRLRWMTAQVQCLLSMLPYVPKAIATGNIDYVDKTVQQSLIPRSILLVLIPLMAVLSVLLSLLSEQFTASFFVKWWLLLVVLACSLFVAIPRPLRSRALFSRMALVPQLAWRMLTNILRIDARSKEFIHTTHDK